MKFTPDVSLEGGFCLGQTVAAVEARHRLPPSFQGQPTDYEDKLL